MLGCGPTTPQDYPEWSGFARRRERECGSPAAAAADLLGARIAGLRSASRAQHRGFEQATGEKSILMTTYSARLPVADFVLDGSAERRKALTRGLAIERPPQGLAGKRTQERDLGLKSPGIRGIWVK